MIHIPRARYVHQSFLTSPFTTLYSLAFCLWHVTLRPLITSPRRAEANKGAAGRAPSGKRAFADLVLLNGPGSCVPIAYAAFLPRVRPTLLRGDTKAIFLGLTRVRRTYRYWACLAPS